jgi:hypothetical protein
VSEAAPAAPAAGVEGAEGARPQPRPRSRWLANIPKTIVATVVVTLLSAWIFPALSHQWQDRQKAREMTASIVSQIGKNTSDALVTSAFVNFNRFPSSDDPSHRGFNQDVFNQLDREWRTSSAEADAELQAYFPQRVVKAWRDYSDLVWGTYRLPTDNTSARPGTVKMLQREFEGQLTSAELALMKKPWVGQQTPLAHNAKNEYFFVSQAVLERRSVVIDEILDSHPAGFSTRPIDVVHDLVPFY